MMILKSENDQYYLMKCLDHVKFHFCVYSYCAEVNKSGLATNGLSIGIPMGTGLFLFYYESDVKQAEII